MRHLGRPGFGDGYLVNVELIGHGISESKNVTALMAVRGILSRSDTR